MRTRTINAIKAGVVVLLGSSCLGCAGLPGYVFTPAPGEGPRPGDYAANYFSAPLSSLYPGNYPQAPTASGSSR